MGLLSILRVADRGPVARRRRRTFTPSFGSGLSVENLESRVVLSHAAAEVASPVVSELGSGKLNITDVNLTNLQIVDGVLTGAGTIAGTLAGLPFIANITDFALELIPDGEDGVCSVLDLELGPIDIDLLGLHVDTSPICLEITATEGGGLLGDLLCGLAGGLPLGQLPALGDLNDALQDILSETMSQAMRNGGPGQGGGDDICDGDCEILNLTLGPVDLSLLGLNVLLDDCEGGPVQVCVSATEGEGLLGDLLCGLAGDGILPDLDDLEGIIGGILDDFDLDLKPKQLDKLVNQVTRLLQDGSLSTKDIARLTKSILKLVR